MKDAYILPVGGAQAEARRLREALGAKVPKLNPAGDDVCEEQGGID